MGDASTETPPPADESGAKKSKKRKRDDDDDAPPASSGGGGPSAQTIGTIVGTGAALALGGAGIGYHLWKSRKLRNANRIAEQNAADANAALLARTRDWETARDGLTAATTRHEAALAEATAAQGTLTAAVETARTELETHRTRLDLAHGELEVTRQRLADLGTATDQDTAQRQLERRALERHVQQLEEHRDQIMADGARLSEDFRTTNRLQQAHIRGLSRRNFAIKTLLGLAVRRGGSLAARTAIAVVTHPQVQTRMGRFLGPVGALWGNQFLRGYAAGTLATVGAGAGAAFAGGWNLMRSDVERYVSDVSLGAAVRQFTNEMGTTAGHMLTPAVLGAAGLVRSARVGMEGVDLASYNPISHGAYWLASALSPIVSHLGAIMPTPPEHLPADPRGTLYDPRGSIDGHPASVALPRNAPAYGFQGNLGFEFH